MAFDVLAIPNSTSTSNSVFCFETMKINPIFNGLDSNVLEALVCGMDSLNNPIGMQVRFSLIKNLRSFYICIL